jgi:alpha-N-acetylglucosaminidase
VLLRFVCRCAAGMKSAGLPLPQQLLCCTRFLLLLLLLLLNDSVVVGESPAVRALLQRVVPCIASSFVLNTEPIAPGASYTAFFEVSQATDGTVTVTGNDNIALSSGIHYALKQANFSVSWWGDNLPCSSGSDSVTHLPYVLREPVRKESPFQWRYYMNVCTFGYSTWSW